MKFLLIKCDRTEEGIDLDEVVRYTAVKDAGNRFWTITFFFYNKEQRTVCLSEKEREQMLDLLGVKR